MRNLPLAFFGFLCLLLTLTTARQAQAQSPSLTKAEEGVLKLSSGVVFVPSHWRWEESQEENLTIFIGSGTGARLIVIDIDEKRPVDTASAVKMVTEVVAPHAPELEPTLRLKEAVEAPYPWEGSLELRPDSKTPVSVYLGSGSNKTVMIVATGEGAAQNANSVAASFKESLASRRKGETSGGTEHQIHKMLGTTATFILLISFLLPAAIALYINRRHGRRRNPFAPAMIGLGVGFIVILGFDSLVLWRFSWAGVGDFVQVFGGAAVRALLLLVIARYLSNRWIGRHLES